MRLPSLCLRECLCTAEPDRGREGARGCKDQTRQCGGEYKCRTKSDVFSNGACPGERKGSAAEKGSTEAFEVKCQASLLPWRLQCCLEKKKKGKKRKSGPSALFFIINGLRRQAGLFGPLCSQLGRTCSFCRDSKDVSGPRDT